MVLENQDNLTIKQAEVVDLFTLEDLQHLDENNNLLPYERKSESAEIAAVKIFTGAIYECKAVVLCTGTYLNARCLCGEAITHTGPNGLQAANHLTDSLKNMGIEIRRFKTGTPARMDKRSLDFSKWKNRWVMKKSFPSLSLPILRISRKNRLAVI